jgi:hypothetical protein
LVPDRQLGGRHFSSADQMGDNGHEGRRIQKIATG